MRKATVFVIGSAIIGVLLILSLFLSIVVTPADVFHDSYNNVLSTKYDTLTNTDSPKIIIITGSSGAFSLDGDLLAKETGMNVANTAIHAGIGALYETELSKANIAAGDIVLLGYEWGWVTNVNYMDTLGTDILMTGIDEKVEMYRYLPVSKYKDVLGYLFTFAEKKRMYTGGASGAYSRSAFSKNGNTMSLRHDGSPIIQAFKVDPGNYGWIDFHDPVIPEPTVKYLKEYKKYVESKGASVYWIGCPTYEEAVQCDYSELQKAANQVKLQIGIEYISNPVDYVFPGKYMYDTIYHTNTLGMEYRTELLAADLKRAGIIKNVDRRVIEDGKTYTFEYSGVPAGFIALQDGFYQIEAWGAGAAATESMYPNSSGKGAYVSGKLKLKKGEILYVYVGGQAGWNGGGTGEAVGGDATDIRLVYGDALDFESLKSRIMVAGGGGGGMHERTKELISAGNAGSICGKNAECIDNVGNSDGGGSGGTQTKAGAAGNQEHQMAASVSKQGGFGYGGKNYGGQASGGGSGYYGGGAGIHPGSTWDGGGGGSSFVSGYEGCDAISEDSTAANIIHTGQSYHYSGFVFENIVMIDGDSEMPSSVGEGTILGNAGNGKVIITFIKEIPRN